MFTTNNTRYERKFVVSGLARYQIESILRSHPAMFSELYYERQVNNIYFDTLALTYYHANISGTSNRLKVRIRWYGDLLGTAYHPSLEIKVKNGNLGSKICYPIGAIPINEKLSLDAIHNLFKHSPSIPEDVKLKLILLNFALLNSYKRKYYISCDKKFRITLDSNLSFWSIHPRNNTFVSGHTDSSNTILELKYDKQDDSYAERITNYLPFRLAKSSKYVIGIQRLNLLPTA